MDSKERIKMETKEGMDRFLAGMNGQERRPSSSSGDRSTSSLAEAKPDDSSASTPEEVSLPKLSRKASQKASQRPPPSFDHLPDVTDRACDEFQVIGDCLYGSKRMGASMQEVLDCDCTPELCELAPRHKAVWRR